MRFPLTGAELHASWKPVSLFTELSLLMSSCFFMCWHANLSLRAWWTLAKNASWGRAEWSLWKGLPLTLDKVLTVTPMSVGVPGGCARVVTFRSKVCLIGGFVPNLVCWMKPRIFFFLILFSTNGFQNVLHYFCWLSFCFCFLMLF